MKIEVLGPGCPKCEKLMTNTQAAVKELGIAADIQKVTDITQFMKYGVMLTPALVVDGIVKCAGKVPSVEEIKKMLS
ncbi:MAG: thioredoxin family protein [Planctomycetota bacterium]